MRHLFLTLAAPLPFKLKAGYLLDPMTEENRGGKQQFCHVVPGSRGRGGDKVECHPISNTSTDRAQTSAESLRVTKSLGADLE